MKKDLTQLVFILDKSGSMQGLESDTIGGFNSLIEKQKKEPGEANVTTVLFDDEVEVIHDNIRLEEVPLLTDNEYYIGGCTALLDAVGETITNIIDARKDIPEDEHPDKTVIVITTDGMENASREYNYFKIKSLIKEKEKEGWIFIFLGANIDAGVEAHRMGINKKHAANFNCDSESIDINFDTLDEAIKSIRVSHELPDTWSCKIDANYKKRK